MPGDIATIMSIVSDDEYSEEVNVDGSKKFHSKNVASKGFLKKQGVKQHIAQVHGGKNEVAIEKAKGNNENNENKLSSAGDQPWIN